MSNTTKCAESKNPEKIRCGGWLCVSVNASVCVDVINMEEVKYK